ncbi:hypothetical protein J3A78_003477 [Streptomyces sp. PvR006]|uniref:hypothetical protein n=1 Tax=Streptomyces sp. PvR006 TaxID=2817860 RepID=UPI001FDA8F03|nr:hypothetical protein [Streptomyces sp. PvR006]MBP2582999.1 hypothetical protein [Streptomyces sp. PvR006]
MTIIAAPADSAKRPVGQRLPATPVRPPRPAGYWERIDRLVAKAPPLTDAQRARIRVLVHQPAPRDEAA